MIVVDIGNEGQDNLIEERKQPMENNIKKLMEEVEVYKQAVQDAKDALASAEMELDEALEMEFENQ